jgi:hypothetical protein
MTLPTLTRMAGSSLVILLCACGKQASDRPASRVREHVAFSLQQFPAEMRAVLKAQRAAGPPVLEPFSAPAPRAPELAGVSEFELLRLFTLQERVSQIQQFPPSGAAAGAPAAYEIEDYAKEVEASLGPLPSFNVFEKGTLIPITLNDVELVSGQFSPTGECDRPALLGLSTDGQCVPYSRIGRLPGINPKDGKPDPNIQWVFIARRYKIRADANDPIFEDIAIIGHHILTGETAFFQMLDHNGKDGTRVPSPMEAPGATPAGHPTAREFWLSPTQTAAAIGCNRCHDNGPFIQDPYVNQVSIVPSDPKGHYKFIGSQAFSTWSAPAQFKPVGNQCTSCHRIGTAAGSESFTQWASGEALPRQLSSAYQRYPQSHWMPPDEAATLTKDEWDTLYHQSVLQLISCNQNPTQPACRLQAVP